MDLVSHNNYFICSMKDNAAQKNYGNIIVNQENALPIYHIESSSCKSSEYQVGDNIIINSIPTKAEVDGKMLFFVDSKNVIGKIVV